MSSFNKRLLALYIVLIIHIISVLSQQLFAFQPITEKNNSLKGGFHFIPGVEEYCLLVKFRHTLDPDIDRVGNLTLFYKRAPSQVMAAIDKYDITFSRAILYSKEDLEILRDPVKRHIPDEKGFNVYNFAGLLFVHTPDSSKEKLLEIAIEFEKLDEVEYASLEARHPEPPPVDFPPTTPDLVSRQTYWEPDPGIDIEYAWSLGLRGEGLTICDIEHSWGYLDHDGERVHEDLHNQDIKYGLPWKTNDYEDHGTAVMGLLLAGENGYGIHGSVPKARGLTFSVMHGDQAITAASIDSCKKGDIVLMEMQRNDGASPETVKSLWDLIKQGAEAGVVIVETAGNGGQNLDASKWDDYRSWGDCGAIVEGAGTSDKNHNRMNYSTYGQNVHVQGWGQNVFTLGYGGFATYGNDPNQEYTSSFSGTSSGGPIVTSAVALVQSFARDKLDTLLTGKEIRELLVSTGIPQGSGGHIGPLPNIKAAIEKLDSMSTPIIQDRINHKIQVNRLFYHQSKIHYFVPADNKMGNSHVFISIYNAKGSKLLTLVNEPKASGIHVVDLKHGQKQFASGVYFCKMEVLNFKKAIRIVII